jgi:hypothetical protein
VTFREAPSTRWEQKPTASSQEGVGGEETDIRWRLLSISLAEKRIGCSSKGHQSSRNIISKKQVGKYEDWGSLMGGSLKADPERSGEWHRDHIPELKRPGCDGEGCCRG